MKNLVLIDKGKAITNSLIIAEKFNLQHKDILDTIEAIINMNKKSAYQFIEVYFRDSRNKDHPYYLMYRGGLSLLSTMFTGKEAQQIYLEFITDFNKMEKQLKGNYMVSTTNAQTIQLAEDQINPRNTKLQNQITMESQIKIFSNSQFGEIRTLTNEQGESLFCLLDLCKGLNLSARFVNISLSNDVVINYPIETNGGIKNALFVNEDGLNVILDSLNPEAKSFRKWVTSEIIPSIRKNRWIHNNQGR